MMKQTRRTRFVRAMMALAMGGSAFQLSGCDPDVRSALLTGLEDTTGSLVDALVAAFFVSLEEDTGTTSP